MANESITWPSAPEDTDENDGTQAYGLGRRFTLTADAPIVGVEWRVPDSLADPAGGPHAVYLWDDDTNTQLKYQTITPTPGGSQSFIFAASHAGVTSKTYVAAVYTNHYAFRTTGGSGSGSTSPSGTAVAGDSVLIPHNSGAASCPIPDQVSAANFYVSPIVEVGGTTPVSTTLTGKWRVYSGVTSTLTGKWRIYQAITSTLTGKWSILGGVVSTLTGKWRVFERVFSTFRGKWTIEGETPPDPEVSADYLSWQRKMTAALIADDPTTITLVPHARVKTGNGGYTEQAGTPRSPQTVKMVLLSNDQRPVTTVAGVERVIDYHLVGPWDMQIAVGDVWQAEDDTTWEVLGFTEGWGYMTKAFIGRHVPRTGRP